MSSPDTATCTTNLAGPGGSDEITASYAGDDNYASSTGSTGQIVDEAPTITSASAATFILETEGSLTVTATGTPAPNITESGELPNGVTFNPLTDVLSGTPTKEGVFPITFTAANGIGANAEQHFTLTVNAAPVITSAAGASFTENVPGTFAVTATGTPTPTIVESGALPSGVTFSDGVLSGTTAERGTYSITFTASNGVGSPSVQHFALVILGLHITTTSLPAATLGVHYFDQLGAEGGTPPYKFSRISGSLPKGLKLSQDGVLAGKVKPKTDPNGGSFTITVMVADHTKKGHQSATATLTLPVHSG